MTVKEKILVFVRATPEESTKYGYNVCVAGITEKDEWRRLYPFKFVYGEKLIDFRKKDIIEVELGEPDNDKRKESRKVLGYTNLNSPLDDGDALRRVMPLLSSIEKLDAENASLGVIKPVLSDIDLKVNDTKIYDDQAYLSMTGEFLEKRENVKMPIELRYQFKCDNEPNCKGHKIILIDWELNELVRNILKQESDSKIVAQKIKERFYDFMLGRDLYFILGTHFKFGTWMIIGLFYPPKGLLDQKNLADY